jgi:nitrile hydratase beta subunit
MRRVHDMGGRFGDGAVVPEQEGTLYHKDWHPRALALTIAAGAIGKWNLDMSRRARESLHPRDYALFTYYEKWLAGLADLLVEQGVATREELSGGPTAISDLAPRSLTSGAIRDAIAKGNPVARKIEGTPKFAPGDRVRTLPRPANRFVPGGHTRLPGYAAAAEGRVLRCHGAHVLPDSNAHGLGERPEPLYSVAFAASELWEAPEHPDDEVNLDLWEGYLEPA